RRFIYMEIYDSGSLLCCGVLAHDIATLVVCSMGNIKNSTPLRSSRALAPLTDKHTGGWHFRVTWYTVGPAPVIISHGPHVFLAITSNYATSFPWEALSIWSSAKHRNIELKRYNTCLPYTCNMLLGSVISQSTQDSCAADLGIGPNSRLEGLFMCSS